MSRYFQSQPVEFLDDAMYKPPAELMASVIQAKDQQADEFFGSLKELQDEVEVDPHAQDVDAARKQENLITGIIDETTQTGMNDVANLYKYQGSLKKAQRKIGDIIDKEITPINEYNKAIKEEKKLRFAEYDKNPEKYDQFSSKAELGAWIDSQYPGYRDEEGALTQTPKVSLRGRDENLDIVKDFIQGHTGMNFSKSYNGPGGGYAKAWKGFKTSEIDSMVNNYLEQNKEIEGYLRQKVEVSDFRGEPTTYQAEKIKLKNDLIETAKVNYSERLVDDRITKKAPTTTTDGGGGTGKDTNTSQTEVSTSEVNPYYNEEQEKLAIKNPEAAVKEFRGDLYVQSQVKVQEGFQMVENVMQDLKDNLGYEGVYMDPSTFKVYRKETVDGQSQRIEVDPNDIFSQYSGDEAQQKYNEYQQKIEQFESLNLVSRIASEDNIAEIRGSEKFNIENTYSENPNDIFSAKQAKDLKRDLKVSYGSNGATNMEVKVSHFKDQPLGSKKDIRLVFLETDSEGKTETAEQATARAQEAYGKDTTLVVLDDPKSVEMYKDGYVDLSYLKKFLVDVDKIKTVSKEGGGDEDLFMKIIKESSEEAASYLEEKSQAVTTTTSENPDVDGFGDFELNADLTQDGAILAKQTVKFGKGSSGAYDVSVVFRPDEGIDAQTREDYDRARQETKSLSVMLEALPGRKIFNSEGETPLQFSEVKVGDYTLRATEDGRLLKNGKRVTNESHARELMLDYIKLKAERKISKD